MVWNPPAFPAVEGLVGIYMSYIYIYPILTRYVYSCIHVLTCLYVCMCVPQPFEVFTSLSCGRVKECACADTTLT